MVIAGIKKHDTFFTKSSVATQVSRVPQLKFNDIKILFEARNLSIRRTRVKPEERLVETAEFAKILGSIRHYFHAPFAVQVNRACPTSGHAPEDGVDSSTNWPTPSD